MFEINDSDLKKRKKNYHFSYSIDGKDFAIQYYSEFFDIILYFDKMDKYNYNGDKIMDNILIEIIDKIYNELLDWADCKGSRPA